MPRQPGRHERASAGAGSPVTRAVPDFAAPVPGPGHVARPRLLRALGPPGASPLVVITGPPGSGKSALVAEWLHRSPPGTHAGWISFDESQEHFWAALTACLGRLGFDLAAGGQEAEPGRPPGQRAAEPEPSTADPPSPAERFLVVLDGLELTSARLAHQADFVLRRFRDQLTLVITSRVDPVLPLPWYRSRGLSVELRESDLRCTDAEAAQLLGRADHRMAASEVVALNRRVGGWLAGLVLAVEAAGTGRSLVPDTAAAGLATGDAPIQEYLLRHALDNRPEPERQFLLQASVVDALVPGLAERVAGPRALETATRLAAAHLFLAPLPGPEAGWRMPPLLRDLLRAHLAFEDPTAWERSNRRAARWYGDHGRVEAAIGHLVTVEAWSEAAHLLAGSLQAARIVAGVADELVVDAAMRLPEGTRGLSARLVLAARALARGQEDLASQELSSARVALEHADRSSPEAVTGAVLSALLASRRAEPAGAEREVATARAAVHELAIRDVKGSDALHALLGLATGYLLLRSGHGDDAYSALVAAAERVPDEGDRLRAEALGYASIAAALSGRLTDAGASAARAVGIFEESGTPQNRRSPVPYLSLALVARDRGDARAVRHHLDQAGECDTSTTGPVEDAVRALVRADQPGAASADPVWLVDAAERLGTSPALADLLRIEAAWCVLPEQPHRAVNTLDAVHDQDRPAALVARAAALRRRDPARAADLLRRAAEGPRSLRSEVLRLVTQADLALEGVPTAHGRQSLDDALTLAAPEKLQHPFRHVSDGVHRLLHTDTALRARHPWLVKSHQHRLGHEAGPGAGHGTGPVPSRPTSRVGPVPGPAHGDAMLVEPLTAKEMEVLEHLNRLLDTEEIAEVMVVSVNTVRTHVRHVLRKLGVDRRNAAVRRGWELGMIPGPDDR